MASRKRKTLHTVPSGLFDSSSDSELGEQAPDPFSDSEGAFGSDVNYEPQEPNDSSSSEDIFNVRPRQRNFSGPVASYNTSKSKSSISDVSSGPDLSDHSDPRSPAASQSPSIISSTAQADNNSQMATEQPVVEQPAVEQTRTNRQRSPEAEDEPWTNTTTDIPEFEFDAASHGPQFAIDSSTSVEQMFEHVFPKEVLDYLVLCTNNYGKALCNLSRPHTRHSRSQRFRDVTIEEMKKFLGICLLHGHVSASKQEKLFTYDDPLYFHPIFTYIMSSRRFAQILRCLSASELGAKSSEKVNKFIDIMTLNFRKIFKATKELSIDESLLLYRGRLHFRQYIKSKKARYGIKFYVLATADGYVLNILMYSGKEFVSSGKKLEDIVLRLMRPYLLKGHHLFMDNYYNSVTLSQKLIHLKTHSSGTLRINRKDNPKEVVNKVLKRGQHVWVRKNKVYVSKWLDKRPVIMLTTRDHPRMAEVTNRFGKVVRKPVEVSTYNKYMAGVDRSDQMISYYSSPRKTVRWYKKVLFHLLDVAVWNAHYLYKNFVKKDQKYEFRTFREKLIRRLFGLDDNFKVKDLLDGLFKKNSNRLQRNVQKNILDQSEKNKSIGHWPRRQPAPENTKKKYSFLTCRVCAKKKKRVETSYRCIGCPDLPPICPECFEEYHQNLEVPSTSGEN